MAVTILSELYRSPNCGLSLADIKPQSIRFLRSEIRCMLERLWKQQQEKRMRVAETSAAEASTSGSTGSGGGVALAHNGSGSPVNSSGSSASSSTDSSATDAPVSTNRVNGVVNPVVSKRHF